MILGWHEDNFPKDYLENHLSLSLSHYMLNHGDLFSLKLYVKPWVFLIQVSKPKVGIDANGEDEVVEAIDPEVEKRIVASKLSIPIFVYFFLLLTLQFVTRVSWKICLYACA